MNRNQDSERRKHGPRPYIYRFLAFDSTGRHYDQTGNYTNWWDDKTVEAFEERAQCFIDQYSNFTVSGTGSEPLHVNGRLTLGENIADAGGLTAAFHAWKKHDEVSPDPLLPGLGEFSKEQLFFIAYGNWWCGKTTREAAEEAIYNDPHAPKSARIIVSDPFPISPAPISYPNCLDCYERGPSTNSVDTRVLWQTRGNSRKFSTVLL